MLTGWTIPDTTAAHLRPVVCRPFPLENVLLAPPHSAATGALTIADADGLLEVAAAMQAVARQTASCCEATITVV